MNPEATGASEALALARSYVAAGQAAEAEAAYRRILDAEPRHVEAASELWALVRAKLPTRLYMSQFGQDAFVHLNLLPELKQGVFVDVGAYDGIEGSNSFVFEKVLGWTGLCVEASPSVFGTLRQNRSCPCVHAAVADRDGAVEFLDVAAGYVQMGGITAHYHPELLRVVESDPRFSGGRIRVPSRRLGPLLEEHGIDRVDYLSIDIEGAERAVLGDVDLRRFGVRAISVENNDGDPAIEAALRSQGYDRVAALGVDEIYRPMKG